MIPYSKQTISSSDLESVLEVLKSPLLTQGPKVPEFENYLKSVLKCKYAVACSNGTSALHLAYASMGVDSNSVGVVPSVTFAATANAFHYLNASVELLDVDPKDGLLNINQIHNKLRLIRERKPKGIHVISPVSLAGKTPNLRYIYQVAKEFDFMVVEDASHSPGAFYVDDDGKNTMSGSCRWSDASTLSFHPVKHICCGEGGAALFSSQELAEKAERLRSHGITKNTTFSNERPWYYEQLDLGWNYRLTDIQATLGIEQIKRLKQSIAQRKQIAHAYENAFAQEPFKSAIDTPSLHAGHAWHLYVIRFRNPDLRDKAYNFLKSKGIITQVHYIPLYRHPYHSGGHEIDEFPGAEDYFSRCLSIPMFPELSPKMQEKVISIFSDFLLQNGF